MSFKNPSQKQKIDPPKKVPKFFVLVLFLLIVAGVEGTGRIVYHAKYDKKETELLKAFMGLAGGYNPNMVSNYAPHPYMVYVLQPAAKYYEFYGTQPVFFINSLGFRGKEFTKEKPKGVYRIFCLGGSTTFSLTESDETKTYSRRLEDELNQRYKSPVFEVINAGTPGWSSGESLINLHFRIMEYDPDMVIIYDGVNDTFAMRKPEEGKSDYTNFRQIVDYRPPSAFTKKLLAYSVLARLWYVNSRSIAFDINSMAVKSAPLGFDEGKQLNTATGKYFKRNIQTMVTVALDNGITPVLVTLGHGLWHPSLTRLNEYTREIAKKKNVMLIDFEAVSQESYFTSDHIHFTREGEAARVKLIADSFEKSGFKFVPHKKIP